MIQPVWAVTGLIAPFWLNGLAAGGGRPVGRRPGLAEEGGEFECRQQPIPAGSSRSARWESESEAQQTHRGGAQQGQRPAQPRPILSPNRSSPKTNRKLYRAPFRRLERNQAGRRYGRDAEARRYLLHHRPELIQPPILEAIDPYGTITAGLDPPAPAATTPSLACFPREAAPSQPAAPTFSSTFYG